MPRRLLVTGADENHWDLLRDLLASLKSGPDGSFETALVNMGSIQPPDEIVSRFDIVTPPLGGQCESIQYDGLRVAFLNIKPTLPLTFPGYDVYMWIDADCWINIISSIYDIFDLANRADIAIHPELDIHYFCYETSSNRTMSIYRNLFGDQETSAYVRRPMVNSGVFSAMATSPIWSAWTKVMSQIRTDHDNGRSIFFSDQIPLHYILNKNNFSIYPLRASYNWQTYAHPPCLELASRNLSLPTAPMNRLILFI